MWDVYTLLCLLSAELSKAFGLTWLKASMLFQNICSDASRVQDCWNPMKTRDMPCAQMLHI